MLNLIRKIHCIKPSLPRILKLTSQLQRIYIDAFYITMLRLTIQV